LPLTGNTLAPQGVVFCNPEELMEAYRTRVHVNQDGSVTLPDLPFQAGEEVEVIVLAEARSSRDAARYPLRGTPLPYVDPFEPVAQDDWDALQ
jgi:hypothetical protein